MIKKLSAIIFIVTLGTLITSCSQSNNSNTRQENSNNFTDSQIKSRALERMLGQESQEINFFKTICVENNSDVSKIRAYFKRLEDGQLPVKETTLTKAPKLRFLNGDYAVGTWDLYEPVTNSEKVVVVTKNGKCEMWTTNKLDKNIMRKEFKDFAYATATFLNGKEEFIAEAVPPNAGIQVDKYLIKIPNSNTTPQIALVIPDVSTNMYQLSYKTDARP